MKENPAATQFFQHIRRQLKKLTRKPFAYRFRRPGDLARLTFPCAGLQTIWESHIEPGFRNNCAIRLVSELRLLGLNENEANDKLFEWNERNGIEPPADELRNVVRSAYQHRFPYRYGCRDDILGRFCPLPSYELCQKFAGARTEPYARANQPSEGMGASPRIVFKISSVDVLDRVMVMPLWRIAGMASVILRQGIK